MRILEHLRSKRFAVAFMVLITLALALSTVIPQASRLSESEWSRLRSNYPVFTSFIEKAHLDRVYSAWWFLLIIALFFLNVSLNLSGRITTTLRQYRDDGRLSTGQMARLPVHDEVSLTAPPDEDLRTRVRNALVGLGYRITEHPDGVAALKRQFGIWSVPLFHASLLIILLGVLVSGLTKFSGDIELSEGQTFHGRPDEFISTSRGLLQWRPDLDFGVTLKSFAVEYWDREHPRNFRSILEVSAEGLPAWSQAVEMNDPLTFRGFSFFQSKYHGYSAKLVVRDMSTGREISGYVNFPVSEDRREVVEQEFHVPMAGYRVHMRYAPAYPDALVLSVFDGAGKIWEGIQVRGASISIGGFMLTFADLVNWTGLHVAKDPGVPVVYAGFSLLVLSVIGIVFIAPRIIQIVYEDHRVLAGGRALRDQEALESEFAEIVSAIRQGAA